MFTGLSASERTEGAHDYESAVACYEAAQLTPERKLRREPDRDGYYPLTTNHKGPTRVGEEGGSIYFRLYRTDVVIWRPDGSVEIDNYGTVTTSAFAHRYLPAGIYLRHKIESLRRGKTLGSDHIWYADRPGVRSWSGRVCCGSLVRFVPQGDGAYLPDEDTCDDMRLVDLDRGKCRKVARQFHLRDFESWLSAAPAHLRGVGSGIEHEFWSLGDCLAALEVRDFRTASQYLPPVKVPGGFNAAERMVPLDIAVHERDEMITLSGSLRKLKLAIWSEEGLFDDVVFKTLPAAEFERRSRRVRELVQLDVINEHRYGIPV